VNAAGAAMASALAAAEGLSGAAHAGDLYGPLGALSFMEGDWTSVAVTKGPGAGGVSHIHADLRGHLLVRRDHLVMNTGGTFDIYMVVYADHGALKAAYVDDEGNEPIHYTVTPGPGPSAVFESPESGPIPGFRLTYAVASGERLHVRFEIAQPGKAYEIYSEGDLGRDESPP
jgi:hypothetical protein